VFCDLDSIVTGSVTVRAECGAIADCVRPSLAQRDDVMNLKKWRSIRAIERRRLATQFANTVGSLLNEGHDTCISLVGF
jgi:hypothetical protein